MPIASPRFGGRLVTGDGTVRVFDSTECLAASCLDPGLRPSRIRTISSIPWNAPGTLADARRCWYLHSDALPSPMTMNLAAFTTMAAAEAARRSHPGAILDWNAVLELIEQRWHPRSGGRR